MVDRALQDRDRGEVTISVKFGAQRDPDGGWLGYDARPAAVKTALAYTLRRLGSDYVDVYRPARLDPKVPIEDTVGAIAELVQAGHVRHVGLSEVGADTIRRAHAVHPISDLQIEYSLVSRGIEEEILPTYRELGIAVAYGVLSRGLLSSAWSAEHEVASGDMRAHMPRFQGENLTRNLALVEQLRSVAVEMGVSAAQVAISWVLSRGEDVIALVGARRREQLAEALLALDLVLSAAQLSRIEAAAPASAVAGERYAPAQMATLDSERPATGKRRRRPRSARGGSSQRSDRIGLSRKGGALRRC